MGIIYCIDFGFVKHFFFRQPEKFFIETNPIAIAQNAATAESIHTSPPLIHPIWATGHEECVAGLKYAQPQNSPYHQLF